VIKFVSDLRQVRGFLSPGPPLFSTNKTDRHDTTEILLKVALNIIEFEDTKGVIRIRKAKTDRQYNGKKSPKGQQRSTKH